MDGHYHWKKLKFFVRWLGEFLVFTLILAPVSLFFYVLLEIGFLLYQIFPKRKK